jgi:hypothetical protein
MFPIADCTKFRYFEVEIVENKNNNEVYLGIIDGREMFNSSPSTLEALTQAKALLICGKDGSYWFKGRQFQSDLKIEHFGDNIGICLQFQSADNIAGAIVEKELSERPQSDRNVDKAIMIQRKKTQLQ